MSSNSVSSTNSSSLQHTGKKDLNISYKTLSLGIFLALVGSFALLSSYRLLPNQINFVAKLGSVGRLTGYVHCAFGAFVVFKSISKQKSKPILIKGSVYIENEKSGPIRKDLMFSFSKRLKTVDGQAIAVKEEDFYVKLNGTFQSGALTDLCNQDKKKSLAELYLPSCLFTNVEKGTTVEEGTVVRFYYDNRLIELTCQQSLSPTKGNETFKSMLMEIRTQIFYNKSQYWFPEDIGSEEQYAFLAELQNSHIQKAPIFNRDNHDAEFYMQDQKANGPYVLLDCVSKTSKKIVFKLDKKHNINTPNNMDVISSEGVHKVKKLWIFIPHKPDENTSPGGASQHDPLKGDRLPTYEYGKYYVHTFADSYVRGWQIGYNEEGLLELKFD